MNDELILSTDNHLSNVQITAKSTIMRHSGTIRLRLTHEDRKTNDESQRLACGLAGSTNPIAKYGDTISVDAGYALCQPRTPDYSWLAGADFSTEEVLQHGVATANTCGKATASPKPGEAILFVSPLTWWEKMKQ